MSPFQMLWKNLEEEIFHTESVSINKQVTTQIVSEQKRNCTGLIKSQKIYAFKGKDSWVSFLLCNARTSRQLITTNVDRTSMLFAKMYQKKPPFSSVFQLPLIHEIFILAPSLNTQMDLLRMLKFFSLIGKTCYSIAHKYFGCSCRHSVGNSFPVFYCSLISLHSFE